MSCGVGGRCGSDGVWFRPAAVAPIRPLAWKSPYAMGVARKKILLLLLIIIQQIRAIKYKRSLGLNYFKKLAIGLRWLYCLRSLPSKPKPKPGKASRLRNHNLRRANHKEPTRLSQRAIANLLSLLCFCLSSTQVFPVAPVSGVR